MLKISSDNDHNQFAPIPAYVPQRTDALTSIAFYLPGRQDPAIYNGSRQIIIGRHTDETCDVMLDLNKHYGNLLGVSLRHAAVHWAEDGHYYLEDLHSDAGTWLNGKRLQPQQRYRLHNLDLIRFAHIVTIVQINK